MFWQTTQTASDNESGDTVSHAAGLDFLFLIMKDHLRKAKMIASTKHGVTHAAVWDRLLFNSEQTA